MKMKIAGIFMAFLCLAMITGSAFAAPAGMPHFTTKIIKVQTNPSTGYHWEAIYDHSKVRLIKNYYTQDPTPTPLIYPPIIVCGKGGIETFVFMGKKGSEIVLEEYPPGKVAPSQSIKYTL
jgi:predicted secreted protein